MAKNGPWIAKILLQEHVNDRCQAVCGARGIGHHVVIGLKKHPHGDTATLLAVDRKALWWCCSIKRWRGNKLRGTKKTEKWNTTQYELSNEKGVPRCLRFIGDYILPFQKMKQNTRKERHRPNSQQAPLFHKKNLDIRPDSTSSLYDPSKRTRFFPSNFRVCDFCPPETSQKHHVDYHWSTPRFQKTFQKGTYEPG